MDTVKHDFGVCVVEMMLFSLREPHHNNIKNIMFAKPSAEVTVIYQKMSNQYTCCQFEHVLVG